MVVPVRVRCSLCNQVLEVSPARNQRRVTCQHCGSEVAVPQTGNRAGTTASGVSGTSDSSQASPIDVVCDACNMRFRVSAKFVGKRMKCRNCGAAISVGKGPEPSATLPLASGVSEAPSLGPEALPAGEPATPKRPRRKKKRRRQPGGLAKWLGWRAPSFGEGVGDRIKIVIPVLGALLILVGYQESRLNALARPEPQTITCAQLAHAGPGDNLHVKMVDFLFSAGTFVYEYKQRQPPTKYTQVWIPAVPLGSAYHQQLQTLADQGKLPEAPGPTDFRIIVKSASVHNENDLHRMGERQAIQGMVINKIARIGGKERKLLEEGYPGVDLDNCWILQEGRKPAGSQMITFYYVGGGLLLGIGVLVLLASGTTILLLAGGGAVVVGVGVFVLWPHREPSIGDPRETPPAVFQPGPGSQKIVTGPGEPSGQRPEVSRGPRGRSAPRLPDLAERLGHRAPRGPGARLGPHDRQPVTLPPGTTAPMPPTPPETGTPPPRPPFPPSASMPGVPRHGRPSLSRRSELLTRTAQPRHGVCTTLLGGTGGNSFVHENDEPAPVLGLQFELGSWAGKEVVKTLTPIFDSSASTATSTVMAKPGYALGGLIVDADRFVTAVRVLFLRVDGDKLDPNDSYESAWIGRPTGKPTSKLAGTGARVLGICGRQGVILDAVGLVMETSPSSPKPEMNPHGSARRAR